jgi:hypothetical protein
MRKALGLLVVSCLFAAPVVHAESPIAEGLTALLWIAQRDARSAATVQESRALLRLSAQAEKAKRLTNAGLNAKGFYIVGSSEQREMDVVVRAVGQGADESANWAPVLAAQEGFNKVGTIEIGISRGLTVEEQGTVDAAAGLSSESRIQRSSDRGLAEALNAVTDKTGEGMMLLNRVQIGAVEGGMVPGDNIALGLARVMKDSFGRWILVRTVKVKAANLDVAILQKMLHEAGLFTRDI